MVQDPGRIIYACGEDMIKLWNDDTIRALLQAQGIRLEDQPGLWVVPNDTPVKLD